MSESDHVAYLTSIYPRASDSYIRSEINALRQLGVDVTTIAIRRPDENQMVSDELRSEASKTSYLLEHGKFGLMMGVILQILRHPWKSLLALRLVWGSHAGGFRNRLKQIVYFAEATALVRVMRSMGVRHVHNHIGENSATVAMAAASMSDVTFSLSIHGPGMFFHPRNWGLGEKIARSAFTACITQYCMSQCMIFADTQSWKRLRVVHCGVDRRFLQHPGIAPTNELRFVCVGRLCPEKGLMLLVEAVSRLVKQQIPIEMHLIGDGKLRGEIERFIESEGLQDNVVLHGWASAEQIRNQLVASRALVLPSFAEGLPVVFMESLAMERPVISTQVAGIPELIENRKHGWLIQPASIDSLCKALIEACQSSPEEIQRMGKFGREIVERNHHAEREAAKLKQLFSAVLSGVDLPAQHVLDEAATPTLPARCA